jgi:hypothetical protein
MQRGIIASGTTLVIGQAQHTAGLQCPEYAAEKHLRFLANAQLLFISYMTVLIYLQAKRRSI